IEAGAQTRNPFWLEETRSGQNGFSFARWLRQAQPERTYAGNCERLRQAQPERICSAYGLRPANFIFTARPLRPHRRPSERVLRRRLHAMQRAAQAVLRLPTRDQPLEAEV